jgi:uncharacterized membrane protein YgaE (UPF0421/DUF939 family)
MPSMLTTTVFIIICRFLKLLNGTAVASVL